MDFTRNAIKASFLKLLDEKPLNKITVKDIVEDCGINRNSFYYHFQDIPFLLSEIVEGEIDRIIEQYPTVDDFEACVKIAVEFTLNHKRAAMHIYRSVNRDIFESYLWKTCDYLVKTFLRTEFDKHKINADDKKLIIGYYKCEAFGQILGWLDGGMEGDIIAANRRLCELRKGFIEQLFARCEDKK